VFSFTDRVVTDQVLFPASKEVEKSPVANRTEGIGADFQVIEQIRFCLADPS